MPGKQGPFGSANGLWAAFGLAGCAAVLTWMLGWLVVGVSELDERCAHGMVGPGGSFRVERSGFPPGVRCVFADGSTVSAGDFPGWVLWACVVVAAACAVLAGVVEFAGLGQARSVVRFGVLAIVASVVLAVLCACVPLVMAPPGREPLSTCSAFGTGVYEKASEVRRAVFPPQATCVYPSGTTHELVPAWWGRMAWAALVAVLVTLFGLVRAVRRHGLRPPVPVPELEPEPESEPDRS
ncbi:hypothetical protein [Streptomyces capillispiralis]|uniref:Uncharacterized protein n=1 Tax=Streptomyces capillispiralis TaxID=68182 RepID=A0A561T7X2_9ACTN|nr:hypothetical protein [Streptomyces capillispiralis]TWF83206.1 hypothetical protein FHX78_11119 [Streptomyces capillispiralis]GHH94557.1 hypothetical protein GCM10017779_50140 [Streptomyces capillispiralis]